LSKEEAHRLARVRRSQKLGAGLVRRARIIRHAAEGLSAPGIAAKMGLCGATVRFWLKRCNERGLGGLNRVGFPGGSDCWEDGAMEAKKTVKSCSPEVKERAVRMVLERQGEHASQLRDLA
jgi:transposase-like protein